MPSPAAARLRSILDPKGSGVAVADGAGYVDLLGDDEPECRRAVQRIMRTSVYSGIYGVGRAAVRGFGRLATSSDDRVTMVDALRLRPGATVLDIGCGPGEFTALFGAAVGDDGLAVGLDASHQMLRIAARDHAGPAVAYLRADAEHLPLVDRCADAVACLAALYLLNDPFGAIDEIARVLQPGGRLAILTSLAPGSGRNSLRSRGLGTFSGLRMFERCEVTDALSARGFIDVEQRTGRLSQVVTATRATET